MIDPTGAPDRSVEWHQADGSAADRPRPRESLDAESESAAASEALEATDAEALSEADAPNADESGPLRQLHPLPRGLVELYGLLAVLFVLVPEWVAGGALFGFREGRVGTDLPAPSGAWKRLPELRLASLSFAELRQLARQLGVRGYGRLHHEEIVAVLLMRLKRSERKRT